jgi:phosphohistidine phosphatase
MELCLVRHAIAEERGPGWPDDARRPLTDSGRHRMIEGAAGLAQLFTPDLVITSPFLRAMQTAEILVDHYGLKGLRISESLATGEHGALLRELERISATRVVLTGHEPHMSGLLSLLLAGDDGLVASLFRKGAAALVTFPASPRPGGGLLEWLLQPSALRALGHAATRSRSR